MTTSSRREIDEEGRLNEQYVQDAFHSFRKSIEVISCPSQGRAPASANLVDIKVLTVVARAEAD
jgi:hypothetical protein